MAEEDPGHQFQMLLKPIEKALRHDDVETALRLTGHLFAIGDGPGAFGDRKVHVLLRALEDASPSVKAAFTAKVLERYGDHLGSDARDRLAGRLDRL